MRIAFMGTPDFAAGILQALVDAGQEIVLVITQPDRPQGRHKELMPSAVKQLALKYQLPLLQPQRIREADALAAVTAAAPDIIIVAAFGQILPKEILELPRYGCINVHASLLPAYRGASPIQHAILQGEEKSGVTIMQMNEGLDTGDILSQEEIPLAEDETGGSLFDKLSVCGASLLLSTLSAIENGTVTAVAQPKESTTPYARMLKKEDGRIDWTKDACAIARQVRAFFPWPGTDTTIDGKVLKILSAAVCGEACDTLPEEAGAFTTGGDGDMLVRCGEGILLVKEVQLAGKKKMRTADFLRGYRVQQMKLGS